MKCTGLKRMLTCLLAAAMVVSYCPMALAEDGNSGAEGNSGGATPSTTTPSAVDTQQPEETEQPQLFNLNSGAGKSLQTGTEDTVQAYAWIPFYAETTHTLANACLLYTSCSGVVDLYPAVTGLPAPGFYQGEIFYCGAGRIHVQLTNLNTPEHRTYKILCVDGGWSDWVSLYDTATITVSDTAPTTVLGNDMIVMVPR